jgi:hypothetical protein
MPKLLLPRATPHAPHAHDAPALAGEAGVPRLSSEMPELDQPQSVGSDESKLGATACAGPGAAVAPNKRFYFPRLKRACREPRSVCLLVVRSETLSGGRKDARFARQEQERA